MEDQFNATLFYADDDIDDLDFFKEVVSEINESVALFESGDKLINKLNNPPPKASIIFLDLNMPGKSGFEVLREIKATPSIGNIPVVILTTSNNPNDIELSKNLGANLYIRKPASIGDLRKAVDHVMSIDWPNFRPSDKQFVYQQ